MTTSRRPITLEFWDVVFSIKTFIAAMLALFIALCFDLTNPYWAVGTVYIVAHPLSGASTSKAIYRLLGTAIGGTMTVILVPNLVNAPELLTLAIALWMSLCLGISLLDRTPRSYTFMLAGYTTALTGFPIVASPDTAFTYATARVEEIALGIICAAVVSRLLFPRHAGPVLSARIDSWLRDGVALAVGSLKGNGADPAVAATGRRLAADAVDLHGFTTHVAYDTSELRDVVSRARTLQRRMVALLPIASGVSDVVNALSKATDGAFTPKINRLITDTGDWLESGDPLSEDKRKEFLDLMDAVEAEGRAETMWNGLLAHNLVARIRDLIQIWSDCLDLREDITSGSHHHLRWRRFGTTLDRRPMHKDYGAALHSGVAVVLATGLAAAFWILTAWPQGGTAAMMAGVLCCIFSTMDDPAPAMKSFVFVCLIAVLAAFVLQFAVLPLVHGYVALALVLGLVLVPTGVLMAKPATAPLGLGFCVNLPNLLGIQDRLSLDLASFINGNSAMVLGMVIACGTVALVRSVGAEWSAHRLVRAGWADIVAAASRPYGADVTGLLHRMVDRLGLAAPRLAVIPADSVAAQADILRDLRIGLNTVELQRHKQLLTRSYRTAIDDVLDAIASHYQAKRQKMADPQTANFLQTLDSALTMLADAGTSSAADGARRAITAVRYNLFPDAAGLLAPAKVLEHHDKEQAA